MTRPARIPKCGRHQTTLPGIVREDSDDELGDKDLPWGWIYAVAPEDAQVPGDDASSKKRKRSIEPKIVGARLGDFECYVGDTVLLKAEGSSEAWVAIICEFMYNEDDEMAANFMWFATEMEVRNRAKKRMDFHQNELYISPSWDVNPLESINGKATVLSWKAFKEQYPNGKVSRNSPDYGKTFICRRGCNTRTAIYTDEFVWEEIYQGSEEQLFNLVDMIKTSTRATKPRPARRNESPEADYSTETELRQAKTPSKSPRTRKNQVGSTTPSHKRIMIKKTLEFTPLATRKLPLSQMQSSPFQLARSRLHVAAVPTSLPCREAEFMKVYSPLEAAIADGTGMCIYISGTPGTGKTATVREVISRLEDSVRSDELDDFIFVEINGMKVTDPHQSYSLLWEALRGERVSASQALDLLEREFSHPSPRRVPCVVLMDELDQLVTKNQSVMYNFFNWPSLPHSRLIVLAVANTMDLPERTLSNKISSRLGLTRIPFPGYNHEQLMKIIHSRLDGIPGAVVEPDAVQFASRKVAAVSGDARRALDICRRAVELAEVDSRALDGTPSKGDSRAKVSIATIKRAINEATTTPIQQHLRSLPFAPKLLLGAMLIRIRRTGLVETSLGDVVDEMFRVMAAGFGNLKEGIIGVIGGSDPTRESNTKRVIEVTEALGITCAAVDLAESGIILLEGHRCERRSKMRLTVGDDEIKMAIRDDAEIKALGLAF